jgi:hypothetical protein
MYRDRVDDGADSSAIGKSGINNGRESVESSAERSQDSLNCNINLSRVKIVAPN